MPLNRQMYAVGAAIVAATLLASCGDGDGSTTTGVEAPAIGASSPGGSLTDTAPDQGRPGVQITPDDAAQVIRNNVPTNDGTPYKQITCVTQENTQLTFTCGVLTADGDSGAVIVRCAEPTGVGATGRPNANCVAGPPGS
jgi:hypothetical protein